MAAETTGDISDVQLLDDTKPADDSATADDASGAIRTPSQREWEKEQGITPVLTEAEKAAAAAKAAQEKPAEKPAEKSALSRDQGDSALSLRAKKEPDKPDPSLSPVPADKPAETSSKQIFGRQTIFHYNYDGSRDKEDPGSRGFFGVNLEDPTLIGAAVPVDILEKQFGPFTERLPDGTYKALDTPEARDIIARIKSSHVLVNAPDGRQVEVPIVDIQGSYKHWHRVLDLTLGATKALGLKDDTYLGYSIVAGDGTVLNVDEKWSDSSPLAKLYQEHGREFKDVYPTDVLSAAKADIAPNMPQDTYERAMREPDGKEQLAKYRQAPKSPGEQLASIEGTPYYGLSKDDLTKKVYSDLVREGKIDPAKTDLNEIGDKLFPNPGIVESLAQLFNWDSSFWKAAQRGASVETHELSGQAWDFPRNLEEVGKLFGTMTGTSGVSKAVDKFLSEHTPLEGWWANLVGYTHGAAQNQQKLAQIDAQRQAQETRTVPGKVGAVVGGAAAGTVGALASTLVPGAPIKSAVAVAAAYEGISRYGQAAQKGQSDALIKGIEGAGMGALSRYMMDAPNGRAMTAFTTWLANTGEDTLSRWLKGEHVDTADIATRSAIDLSTGWLMGKARERPRTGLAEGLKTDEEVSTGAQVERNKILRSEAQAMQIAKENGDHDGAIQHGNRALAALDGEEQKQMVKDQISLSEKWADNKATPGTEPTVKLTDTDRGMISHFAGLGSIEALEDRTLPLNETIAEHLNVEGIEKNGDRESAAAEKVEPHAIRKLREVNPEAADRFHRKSPDEQAVYLKELHATKPEWNPESDYFQGGAEFQAGLSFAPAVRALRGGIKAIGRADPLMAVREKMGGVSPEMTAIIRARRSEAEEGIVRLPAQLAHDMRVDKVLRGGEKTSVRRDFFSRFPQSVQLAMMIAHEKGKPAGHAVAQELFKLHDAIYKAIEGLEKRAGFKYDAREIYIYHLIKGGKPERERFERYYNALVASDPRFTHSRYFGTLEALHKAGFKLETYNPEELLQRRLFQSQMGITKVMQLRDAERAGMAYRTDHPGLSADIKAWGEPVRAPNGERYYLRPDAQVPLRNAWDLTSLYSDRVWGRPLKALAMFKGAAVPWKLGWSFVHGRHIALKMNVASFASTMSRAIIHGNARGQVWATELERLLKLGYAHSAEVQALQGKRIAKGLSLEQKTNIKHFEWAGLSARISDETRMSFDSRMRQVLSNQMERLGVPRGTRASVHGAATVLQAGYDVVSSKVMQHWMFHTLIPQIKFSQFLGMRDQLIREHPLLLEDGNEFRLKKELSKIGESVEARFGEMFHDNLLWKKTWKDIGTASLLSFGWNLGAVRIYAGAIRDTAALGAKILEDSRISKDDLTDRMLFAGWYTALNMAEAGLITYTSVSLWNTAHPNQKQDIHPSGMDWVFPRVGYDERGRAKRVTPVEYSREFSTWWQHTQDQGLVPGTAEMIRNKLSPVLSTLIDDFQNKNFYGQNIYDPNDPWLKQVQDTVGFSLSNTFGPISLATSPLSPQQTGKQKSWVDSAWAAVGFPPAAAWTGRTAIENRIVDTFYAHNPQWQKTEQNTQRAQQYEALRQATVQGNTAAGRAAEKALKDLGVPKSSISYVRNHPRETYEMHLFKSFPALEQEKLFNMMSPEEKRAYWPVLHKDLKAKYPSG